MASAEIPEDLAFMGSELILRLENARPIKAAAFARVLRDLSSDYKRLYRDELVIVAMPEGSLVAKLRAFSKFAEEANHVVEFGKNLAMIFAAGAVSYAALTGESELDGKAPLKAAQSLAGLAAQTESRVGLESSISGQNEVIINATPAQAKRVEGYAKAIQRNARSDASAPAPATLGLPIREDGNVPEDFAISPRFEALKTRLLSIGQKAGGFASLDPDVRELIVTLVLALHDAAPFRLSQLVRDLELGGHSEAAALVREIIGPPRDPIRALLPSS